MKKYKVVVLNQAKKDVREARNWYNQQQKGLGKRFTTDIRRTFLSIAENPTAFAVSILQTEKQTSTHFPYGAFFFIDIKNVTVYITSIMHHSRNVKEV